MSSEPVLGEQHYKVKLASGRVLGPIDLDRVRLLVLKNQIVGQEEARLYPQGEWGPITRIPEIADLLMKRLSGELTKEKLSENSDDPNQTIVLPGVTDGPALTGDPLGLTEPLVLGPLSDPSQSIHLGEIEGSGNGSGSGDQSDDRTMVAQMSPSTEDGSDRTMIARPEDLHGGPEEDGDLDIQLGSESEDRSENLNPAHGMSTRQIVSEKTIVLRSDQTQHVADGKGGIGKIKKGTKRFYPLLRIAAIGAAIWLAASELGFIPDGQKKSPILQLARIRPTLPQAGAGDMDPARSEALYLKAIPFYLKDTVAGYQMAVELFQAAATADISNVKALALLASAYLNLIDNSNKDENYFSVISKLIELARAKESNLAETVIADVEFFVLTNQIEAAQDRIVGYSKTVSEIPLPMFYYLGYAYYHRGDFTSAARYLGQIPDQKVPSPKMFYLRGRIAEALSDQDSAQAQYEKALALSPSHAKSRLALAQIRAKRGQLKEVGLDLTRIVDHPELLSPKELAQAYFLHSQWNSLERKFNLALSDVERAVKLDSKNQDYLLELYTLRSKLGDTSPEFQKEARMYYFMGEGERLNKEGNYQEAVAMLLKARQANINSPYPLAKLGDVFLKLNDIASARFNYEQAAERAPNAIEIWSKYIDLLIKSFDWEKASRAMERFRNLPVQQSALDKLAGDIYYRQGLFSEAQAFYKKAMSREIIDSDVYVAYANSLFAQKNFKDAPFFYALALRFDPFNPEAVVGTARCLAANDSIDRGVSYLQEQLERNGSPKAELLTAIADLDMQKGEYKAAEQYINQAVEVDPSLAKPWKTKAELELRQVDRDKNALGRAIEAYTSYLSRNPSDPQIILERHQAYVLKKDYAAAEEDLMRVLVLYPKYPGVHYLRGKLNFDQGRLDEAKAEYEEELKVTPNSLAAHIGLGRIYSQKGNAGEALRFLGKAVAISPKNAEAKSELGWANYMAKNGVGARALLESAVQLDPGNPLHVKRLAYTYRAIGQGDLARQMAKRYLDMDPTALDRSELERF